MTAIDDAPRVTCGGCGGEFALSQVGEGVTLMPVEPKPRPVPVPELVYRKENKALLAVGLILFALGLVVLPTVITVFIGDRVALLLCSGLLMGMAVVGLILLVLGFSARQTVADPQALVGEHARALQAWLEDHAPGDVDWIDAHDRVEQYWLAQKVQVESRTVKQRKRLRLWGIILMAVSVELLILALVLLWSTAADVLAIFLPLTLLPGLLGLFLVFTAYKVHRRAQYNLDALRDYQAAVTAWRDG